MRLKISLASGNDEYRIPYNYNYQLSSLIYRKIADLDLASDLHISSDFKFFTFSQFYVPQRRITKNDITFRYGVCETQTSNPQEGHSGNLSLGLLETFKYMSICKILRNSKT